MTRGATFSFMFHVAVVLLAIYGLPLMAKPEPMLEKPILVDIVTIAKVTNLPDPTPKVEPKPEPKAVEPKPEPPKPEPPKPEPQKVETPPPPPPPPPPPKVVEPKPEPPKPEPPKPAEAKPEPAPKVAELKPEPKPEPPKVEPPKPEPPKPQAKVEPPKPAPPKPEPPKPQPKKDDTFDRLLKDLANKKPATEPAEQKPKTEPPKPQQQAAVQPTPNQTPPPRPMTDGQLTLSELDAIRAQIGRCWNVPAGARDARNLIVELQVDMNPDASVRSARIVDDGRMSSDPFFRAAAESAMRAVLNPQCNPLRLPREKFDIWKSFTLSFNPKEML